MWGKTGEGLSVDELPSITAGGLDECGSGVESDTGISHDQLMDGLREVACSTKNQVWLIANWTGILMFIYPAGNVFE